MEANEELSSQLSSVSSVSSVSSETLEAISGARNLQGRFGKHPWQIRAIAFGQLGRRVAPSALAANIADALRFLLPPDIPWALPSVDCFRKMRGELAIASETIAALRIAQCKRVCSFGFDESSKKQVWASLPHVLNALSLPATQSRSCSSDPSPLPPTTTTR